MSALVQPRDLRSARVKQVSLIVLFVFIVGFQTFQNIIQRNH
jgi:hypothetical protein